jgi:hypothetical protein
MAIFNSYVKLPEGATLFEAIFAKHGLCHVAPLAVARMGPASVAFLKAVACSPQEMPMDRFV